MPKSSLRHVLPWTRRRLPRLVAGLVVVGVVGLCAWGLIRHFTAQTVAGQPNPALPAGYHTARTQELDSFTAPGAKTTLIIASNNRYLASGPTNDLAVGDIIYLFSQKGNKYTQIFKYEPYETINLSGKNTDYGFAAASIQTADLDHDGKNELIVGWSHIGAGAAPPVPIIMQSTGNTVSLTTLRAADATNPQAFTQATVKDALHTQAAITAYPVQGFFVGPSGLLTYEITTLVCEACTTQNHYDATEYRFANGRLSPAQTFKNLGALPAVEQFAHSHNYR